MKRTKASRSLRNEICEFLRVFYQKDWVAGTGGGICAVLEDNSVLMAPTGVHKERVRPDDLFVVDSHRGAVIRPSKNKMLHLTECNSIFCLIIRERGAGSVMHSHALSAVLAADLVRGSDRVVLEGLEMIKGIQGCGYFDKHPVPVIENMAYEPELVGQIKIVLAKPDFASSYCILVRDHGAYLWGRDLWEAKRHAEVYHFLFEAITGRARFRSLPR